LAPGFRQRGFRDLSGLHKIEVSCTACSFYDARCGNEGTRKGGAMGGSIPAPSGRIFMSYRREETAYPAGWLFDRLTDRYGSNQVFRDVDSIELGDDFVDEITSAVGSCDVLLALIGEEWVTITDANGRRRLDDPDDFVRLEIEAALTRRVRVIPILVGEATMPRADELPDSLARLVRRQALELSPARFDSDLGRLLKVLDRTLAEVRVAQEDAATTELPQAPKRREQAEPGPTPSRQRRRLSTRARVLAGAGVGVVLLLVIVAIVAKSGTRSPTGAAATTSPPTTEPVAERNALLAVVPDSIEASCHMYDHDEILGESLAFMQCSSAGVRYVRLALYQDKDSLDRMYWDRVTKAGLSKNYGRNNCTDNKPSESAWQYKGRLEDAGRYFCHRDSNDDAWIEWTYNKETIYAYAYRPDNNIKAIYQWWFNF
jgi:TIR domain